MNINIIKKNINKRIGDNVKIIYNGSRNKKEEYYGTLAETYDYIFIVKTNKNKKKSFNYRDILTNTIEICFK